MDKRKVLVVDDEKNIRLTLSKSLEPLGLAVDTAVNGEEALVKIADEKYDLMLLDIKMPGMDGIEVLRKAKNKLPGQRVIMITAHGTIDSAVEAMKLGAIDFIQKPFSTEEIRTLVSQVLDRDKIEEEDATDYASQIALTKKYISELKLDDARRIVKQAISFAPDQPEAFNLLGVLYEIAGNKDDAAKFYRAALDVERQYKPASANLHRVVSLFDYSKVDLGSVDDEESDSSTKDKEA